MGEKPLGKKRSDLWIGLGRLSKSTQAVLGQELDDAPEKVDGQKRERSEFESFNKGDEDQSDESQGPRLDEFFVQLFQARKGNRRNHDQGDHDRQDRYPGQFNSVQIFLG